MNLNKSVIVLFMTLQMFVFQQLIFSQSDTLTPLLSEKEMQWLKEHPDIMIAYDAFFPPYSYYSKKGEMIGLSVDIVNLLGKKTGIDFTVYPKGEWDDLYESAKRKEVDVIATLVNRPDRNEWFNFTKNYIRMSTVFFVRNDNSSIKTPDDITGKKVALVTGYASSDELLKKFPGIIPVYSETILDALIAVSVGKADVSLATIGETSYYSAEHGITNLKAVAVYSHVASEQAIGVRKDWPELASILDKGLTAITVDEMDKLQHKWISINQSDLLQELAQQEKKLIEAKKESEANYWRKIKYSAAFFIPLLMLVILIISWNRTLKRKVIERTKELTASQKIIDEFFEHSPIYVYFKDKNLRSLKLSRNFEQMIGRPLDELLNKTMDELFPSELAKKMIEDDKKILKEGKLVIVEEELNSKNYLTYKFPIFINGKPEYLAGYTIDITERKDAQNKIKVSEEKYRKMFDNASVGIAVVGLDKKFISCNTTFCTFTGYSENELIGKTIADITHPDDIEIGMKEMKMIIEGKLSSYITQKRYVRKGGMTVWGQINISLVRNSNGEPAFFLPVLNDITKMKASEAELKETAEELRQMNSFMVDRELKMVELKNEINELLKKCGSEPKY